MLYGATRQEWEAWESLRLRDLLPTVCDPNVPLSSRSELKSTTSKVPTVINAHGEMHGIKGWTTKITTSVHDWMADPRLGICLVTRELRAFDIDIDDQERADMAEAIIVALIGPCPTRIRANSPRRALLYRVTDAPEHGITKRILHLSHGGAIEFLQDKQQLVVAGTHRSGSRYEWRDGIPTRMDQVPAISLLQLAEVARTLHALLGGTDSEVPLFAGDRALVGVRHKSQVASSDPIVQFLYDNGHVKEEAADGALYVHCPWEEWHGTADNNPTSTAFFPQGLGEFHSHPGFKCMHAHSKAPPGADTEFTHVRYLAEIGYTATEFPVVPMRAERKPMPPLTRKGKSEIIEATLSNIVNLFEWSDGFGYVFRYDTFKDIIVYRNDTAAWKLLDDDTYTALRLHLTTVGMEPTISKELVRDAVSYVARQGSIDSAQEWLDALQWDGRSRIATFHRDVLNLPESPYHKAVSHYMWTALAGRILDPGCKADMVPIFIGRQGLRKSTLVEKLAPHEEMFVAISLADRDDNLSRLLRGKLVAEWDEMRGLQSRDQESIKGWVTRRQDEWIPKFKEFGTAHRRRFVLFGTSNPAQILNDPTGNRRWLPLFLVQPINVDHLVHYRTQLWAEARELFEQHGVMWQAAERLAAPALRQASVRDVWVDPVTNWLAAQGGVHGWTTSEILHGAVDVQRSQQSRGAQERLVRVMAYIGWEEKDGKWYCNFV